MPPSSNDTGVSCRRGVVVDGARGRGRAGEGDAVDVARGRSAARRPARRCRGRCSARPAGGRARSARSPSIEHVSGAHSGGLSTTVLPAASAGPTRQVASMKGAFHGVETATTPAGSWRTVLRSPPGSVRGGSSRRERAQSAKKRMLFAARGSTRARIASCSEPLSTHSTAARSGTAASISSARRVRISWRPCGPERGPRRKRPPRRARPRGRPRRRRRPGPPPAPSHPSRSGCAPRGGLARRRAGRR